ncbi:uncharacterized protein KGF55_001495 [Candida pseudojiufengensis]|uniref:uncharacterized protein n=1 Tax=Candida pseudojiufengensis TaxID=497109 RepID=UPI0022249149|nr:uncharacterized protein KGF55_001495 [Candida pseudojiufengensis]KAI5965275.1 hypothetical protein KGF55_001495 [Candida pseudojiufengensis]
MTNDEQILDSTTNHIEDDSIISNKLDKEIIKFPIYRHFIDQYSNFTLDNHETLNIEERIYPNLTGYTLSGPKKIEYRSNSLYFIDDYHFKYNNINESSNKKNYSITFLYLGDQLSGHNGIVHGGLLATLLDELTCRVGFLNFKSKRGVTANLNINYKKPTKSNSWILIKCTVLKKIDRKCWVKGEVYLIDENKQTLEDCDLLCDCEVLIIEPKWVNELK